MALSGSALEALLATSIKDELNSKWPPVNAAASTGHTDLANTLAKGIAATLINYLVTNTVVATPAGPGTIS